MCPSGLFVPARSGLVLVRVRKCLLFLPSGGWWHQVLSLTDSVSLTYNMLDRWSVSTAARSLCANRRHGVLSSRRACLLLQDLRPEWYARTCCPAFVRAPGASAAHPHANEGVRASAIELAELLSGSASLSLSGAAATAEELVAEMRAAARHYGRAMPFHFG